VILHRKIQAKIRETFKELDEQSELLSKTQIDQLSKLFRERFGPEKLSRIDGEELLEIIHNASNKDSIFYWLDGSRNNIDMRFLGEQYENR
jgi:5-methylcytosine-specific restriction protein B